MTRLSPGNLGAIPVAEAALGHEVVDPSLALLITRIPAQPRQPTASEPPRAPASPRQSCQPPIGRQQAISALPAQNQDIVETS